MKCRDGSNGSRGTRSQLIRMQTLGIFIDFTKTFDHLNHRILKQNLEQHRICGITPSLTKLHLEQFKQCVYHNWSSSSTLQSDDIFDISNSATFVTYTDDTSIFLTDTNPNKIITTPGNITSLQRLWVENSCLKINPNKAKAVFFTLANKLLTISKKYNWVAKK